MDDYCADVACVFEADVCPNLSSISRFVNAIPKRDVAADASFARTGVDYVGIGVGHGDSADRGGGLLIEQRIPRDAAIRRFPDTAADRAEIIGVRLAGNTGDGDNAAAAEWADESPLHAVVGFGIDLLSL